ncbi:AhpD family alkylhydroperoxidase [Nocardiopsis sp. Huas11]|uniref:carboxymuconolactone decarboxylase family protein n=1 Tax=Nocardiopsis sp. Huas11 TaxID=2183912 RepID=UPI000F2007B6|nr:carboxymuconolactone decarboxylase family protein [Nocardiopsis sp. Huas11]RKS07114.1 AhpD family alkylhydroperoxidase [Nocardiopsis sp. Huas11]
MTTFQIPERMDFARLSPKVLKAVLALDAAAREGVDPVVLELVQIRASQINGCAYCVDYHVGDARKAGEDDDRLHQLAVWRESSLYTARERAALALAEAVTLLPGGVPDEVYAAAERHFEERELAQLIAVVFTVNTWNRMNATTRKTPGTA